MDRCQIGQEWFDGKWGDWWELEVDFMGWEWERERKGSYPDFCLGTWGEMPPTEIGALESGKREVKVGRPIISFVPEALERNPSRNAQKADKYIGLNKEIFHMPTAGP